MKKILGWSSALCLSAIMLQAQETNEISQLKEELRQLQQEFERTIREQRQQIETLTQKLDVLTKAGRASPQAPANVDDRKALEQQLAAELAAAQTNRAPQTTSDASKPWSAAQPITLGRAGTAYMNISFDALINAGWSTAAEPGERLQLGHHDPLQRGFSLRNAEIALDGAVDPYFKGFANILFTLDAENETDLELEEVYLVSSSLPANLQLKAGQFFAAFGRHNGQHPHQWSFVDAPVILPRVFGPDGLRNVGAQLSWLAPTRFYTEVLLGMFNGQGETTHSFRNRGEEDDAGVQRFAGRATLDRGIRGLQDFVFVPRIASSIELTDTQTLLAGISGAFGPNDTGPQSRTEIYGADVYWKWKPMDARAGFPFVSLQTEVLYRRLGADADLSAPTQLPSENLRDWGFYSQILWGFKPRWVAGLRGEFVDGNSGAFDAGDPFRGERYRLSPVLTFYPSEFSKVRLQYNLDRGESIGTEHSVWLQMEFLLGAHGAHKF